MKPVVYDAAVLVAADRNDRRVWAEHQVRVKAGVPLLVPAAVVAQVSRAATQANLRRLLRGCEVVMFDEANAHSAGALLAATGTSDVVDAAVVTLAIQRGANVLTGDGEDSLARDDDRSAFSCGQPDLDRFFEHYAGPNQFKLHLAVTYVAVANDRILGFATVAAASIERADVPGARLRKRLPGYPLPVLRLARLGVDTRAQGLGIGKALLRHVLRIAIEQRDHSGCVGVVTDAKAEAVSFYASLGFVSVEGVREGLLSGEPLPMFLAVGTVASLLER